MGEGPEENGNSKGSSREDDCGGEVGCCSPGLCRGSLSGAGWAQLCFPCKGFPQPPAIGSGTVTSCQNGFLFPAYVVEV